MEKLSPIFAIQKSVHQIPAILSLLVGLFIVKKRVYPKREEPEFLGDNMPFTLIDSLSLDITSDKRRWR